MMCSALFEVWIYFYSGKLINPFCNKKESKIKKYLTNFFRKLCTCNFLKFVFSISHPNIFFKVVAKKFKLVNFVSNLVTFINCIYNKTTLISDITNNNLYFIIKR